jgi:hypothetical protein
MSAPGTDLNSCGIANFQQAMIADAFGQRHRGQRGRREPADEAKG